jgi:hypothetical protein
MSDTAHTVHIVMCSSLLYVLSMWVEYTNCDEGCRVLPLGDVFFDTIAVPHLTF